MYFKLSGETLISCKRSRSRGDQDGSKSSWQESVTCSCHIQCVSETLSSWTWIESFSFCHFLLLPQLQLCSIEKWSKTVASMMSIFHTHCTNSNPKFIEVKGLTLLIVYVQPSNNKLERLRKSFFLILNALV